MTRLALQQHRRWQQLRINSQLFSVQLEAPLALCLQFLHSFFSKDVALRRKPPRSPLTLRSELPIIEFNPFPPFSGCEGEPEALRVGRLMNSQVRGVFSSRLCSSSRTVHSARFLAPGFAVLVLFSLGSLIASFPLMLVFCGKYSDVDAWKTSPCPQIIGAEVHRTRKGESPILLHLNGTALFEFLVTKSGCKSSPACRSSGTSSIRSSDFFKHPLNPSASCAFTVVKLDVLHCAHFSGFLYNQVLSNFSIRPF